MLIQVLKSKISFAKLTQKELNYVGSITIDSNIMEQAHLCAHEKVQVVNLNNGERLETYVIPGKPNSKIFALNGPAARKGEVGDELFILSYAMIDPRQEKIEPVLIDMNEKFL